MIITGDQIHNNGGMDGYSSKCLLLSIQRYIQMRGINVPSDFLLEHFDARHHDMMLADEAFVQKLKELLEGISLDVDKFIVLNILIDGRYHIATYFKNSLSQEVTIHTDIDFDEVFANSIVVVGTGSHFELLENVRFVDDEEEIEKKQDDKQEEMEQDELMARQLKFLFEQEDQERKDEEMARRLQEQERKDEEMARRLQEQERKDEEMARQLQEQERKDEEMARRLQEEQEQERRVVPLERLQEQEQREIALRNKAFSSLAMYRNHGLF